MFNLKKDHIMKKSLPIVLLSLFYMVGFSQDTVHLYLDANYRQVEKKRDASVIRELVIKNDHYFLKDQSINGKMLYYGEFISINPFIEDGLTRKYNNGELCASGHYKKGFLSGAWIYINGKYADTVDFSLAESYYHEIKDDCVRNYKTKEALCTKDSSLVLDDLQSFMRQNFHTPLRVNVFTDSVDCNINFLMDTTGHIICPDVSNSMNKDIAYELLRLLFLYKCNVKIETPLKLTLPFYYDISPAFVFVEKQAEFQDGSLEEFRTWVQDHLVYPPDAKTKGITGRVTLQFAVSSRGDVIDVKILRGSDPSFDREAYRVVSSSPKWEAARQGGRAVRQQFVMPVIFDLPESQNKTETKKEAEERPYLFSKPASKK